MSMQPVEKVPVGNNLVTLRIKREEKKQIREEREREWEKLEQMKNELRGKEKKENRGSKDDFQSFFNWVTNGQNDLGNSKNVLFANDD